MSHHKPATSNAKKLIIHLIKPKTPPYLKKAVEISKMFKGKKKGH